MLWYPSSQVRQPYLMCLLRSRSSTKRNEGTVVVVNGYHSAKLISYMLSDLVHSE